MSCKNKKKAIIIGCGIAGPTLALSLKRAGIDSIIYEAQEKHLDNVGLMIYLSPFGCNVLKTLGLFDKIKHISSICKKIEFNDYDGGKIVSFDQSNHDDFFGVNTLAVKRGDFNRILREEVQLNNISIKLGKKLTNIETSENNSVTAFFEDGTNVEGDFIVGCDGINSSTRQIIMPGVSSPTFTGSYVVGGAAGIIPPNDKPTNTLCFNFGKKSFFVYYVTSAGKAVWGCNIQVSKESVKEKTTIPDNKWKEILLNRHKDDDIFFRNLIKSTKDKLLKLPVYDLPSLPFWHVDLVCLTGDAAHAVAPHAGQGASLAMESAMMLAKCLRDVSDVRQAFVKYEKMRMTRVKKMQRISRQNIKIFSFENPIKKWIRKMLFLFLSDRVRKKQELEMYGYKIDWDKKIHVD